MCELPPFFMFKCTLDGIKTFPQRHTHARQISVPCIYLTTLTLRPCLEMVVSTSPALLLQGRLWGGHQEVMALNRSWRSSFWASSSAGDTKVQSFTRICKKKENQNYTRADSTVPTEAGKENVGVKFSAAFQILYLHEDFLQECPPVRRSQLLLGLNLTWGLLLDGCWRRRWRRRLRRGTYWCLSHVGQVEEQVEAFDQCGWYGHGGHAVHSFLAVKEETETRSSQ